MLKNLRREEAPKVKKELFHLMTKSKKEVTKSSKVDPKIALTDSSASFLIKLKFLKYLSLLLFQKL